MRIAFFDTKDYDKIWFEKIAPIYGYDLVFYETRCTEDTAILASGCDAVCAFVNCELTKKTVDKLYRSMQGKNPCSQSTKLFSYSSGRICRSTFPYS